MMDKSKIHEKIELCNLPNKYAELLSVEFGKEIRDELVLGIADTIDHVSPEIESVMGGYSREYTFKYVNNPDYISVRGTYSQISKI